MSFFTPRCVSQSPRLPQTHSLIVRHTYSRKSHTYMRKSTIPLRYRGIISLSILIRAVCAHVGLFAVIFLLVWSMQFTWSPGDNLNRKAGCLSIFCFSRPIIRVDKLFPRPPCHYISCRSCNAVVCHHDRCRRKRMIQCAVEKYLRARIIDAWAIFPEISPLRRREQAPSRSRVYISELHITWAWFGKSHNY